MQMPNVSLPGFEIACAEADIPHDGTIITRLIEGKSIAIAWGDTEATQVVAFESRCPHMKAPLKFGRVVNGEVVCPWHFMRFDTNTGETVRCESIMHLETFSVEVVDGNVYVNVAK